MKIPFIAPEYRQRIIVLCKHRGDSFYAFIDFDYPNELFRVQKTVPVIRENFSQIIPFKRIMKNERFLNPETDSLCLSIENKLMENLPA